jgi:UDP-N-acetylglucosamine transferase subunit ALG13
MRAHKVTRVISTGSQIALSAYLAAKLLRVPFAYVESATRVTELSTTGKILDRVPGVYRYVQHTSAAPSSKWRVALSVFDGFNAESTGRPRPIRRVVVTLGGNGEYAFGRLIERIRDILPADAEVLWQLGSTPDQRLPGRVVSSIPSHELFEALTNADVVIGHAGTGTAITALSAGKLPVLSPRQAAFGEHVDGHQEDLARALADLGLAVVRHADDISLSDLELAAERIVKTSSNQGPVDLFAHGTTPARRRKSH